MIELLKRVLLALKKRISHQIILFNAKNNSIQAIDNRKGNNVLVLCYGNIYRSPLVEYLFRQKCKIEGISLISAGFYHKENRKCDPNYLELLIKKGYDLGEHRSKRITEQKLSWADIIIIMDRYNYDNLMQLNPEYKSKVVWIGSLSNIRSIEISDPYGKDNSYVTCVIEEIELCVSDICSILGQESSSRAIS